MTRLACILATLALTACATTPAATPRPDILLDAQLDRAGSEGIATASAYEFQEAYLFTTRPNPRAPTALHLAGWTNCPGEAPGDRHYLLAVRPDPEGGPDHFWITQCTVLTPEQSATLLGPEGPPVTGAITVYVQPRR